MAKCVLSDTHLFFTFLHGFIYFPGAAGQKLQSATEFLGIPKEYRVLFHIA